MSFNASAFAFAKILYTNFLPGFVDQSILVDAPEPDNTGEVIRPCNPCGPPPHPHSWDEGDCSHSERMWNEEKKRVLSATKTC